MLTPVVSQGTGTPTGDPIEVKAVARGMNDNRSIETPLLLGAAKANIGHSEAVSNPQCSRKTYSRGSNLTKSHIQASGIFAAMKAALMTENAEIPGVYGFNKLNPNIKDEEWNVKIVQDLMPWPTDFNVRRASVSSFGYGGTNAHLVIEAVQNLWPRYEHGKSKATATYDYNGIDRPFLITMSAHDEKTLVQNIHIHKDIAAEYHLPDLAYSLNERKTKFATRAYTIATPGGETKAFSPESFVYGSKLQTSAKVGFILSGQGSTWARMGYEAIHRFSSFGKTIDSLDQVLQYAVEPKPTWNLREVLEESADSSRIGDPEIAQPACTAIQIAVIDLFALWGIEPAVSIGHSSGEIPAAYASGRVSAPEAILAAYFRGLAVVQAAPVGTMLAVGLGADQVQGYFDFLPSDVADRLTIACENSPTSVTISGDYVDVAAFKSILEDRNIFARELKTGKAYHSPQMDAVAPLYEELYSKAHKMLKEPQFTWRRPCAAMFSSVTGYKLDLPYLPISYWCENLCNRVLFNTAVQTLGNDPDFADINILLEIGPHSTLGGPVKQIIAENNFEITYVGTLARGKDDVVTLLKSAGELYLRGLDVDFKMINSLTNTAQMTSMVAGDGNDLNRQSIKPLYLPDLPPYQWNYEERHWFQPRAVAEMRESKYPRHDILGRRIFGLSTNAST